ncbi:UDP-N-acetylmuramoyl-tripeptide--D-alanyl-D-alanine ligase [Candidatus Omnitrophota bacterium]
MFKIAEIARAVSGKLSCGNPQLRISGVSIDSRTIKRGELFIAINGRNFNGHNFIQQAVKKGAAVVIMQPRGHRLKIRPKVACIEVPDTSRALGDLARFHRQRFEIPVVAVTGSCGKTTVKEMIAQVLSEGARVLKNPGTQNNNIGVPLALLKLQASHDIAVLELGTNHFGEIDYLAKIAQPNIGVITNIAPVHLDNFKNLEGVYKEKLSLLANLKPPRIAVLNADDARLKKVSGKKLIPVTYGTRKDCDFSVSGLKLKFDSKGKMGFLVNAFRRLQLNTIGPVNIYNALAAVAVARIFGQTYHSISRRMAGFKFPAGRLRFVKLKGLSFVDDTYNANPASFKEALAALSKLRVRGRRIIIMGDMLELGASAIKFHRQIGNYIAGICDTFISVGELSRVTAERVFKSGLNRNCIFHCKNSLGARDLLFNTIKPSCDDIILVKGSRLMKMEEVIRGAGSK